MYQNILVPVNGTEISKTAVPHALEMAEKHDAVVHSLCAYNREGGYGSLSVDATEQQEMDLRSRAEQIATDVADQAESKSLEAVSAVSSGDPADSIINYVDDQEIDLVVIGARKRSPTGKLLFGSVTQAVILHVDVPVVVTG